MVYGYCRVSTKGQAKDGNSIEAQEAAVREAGAEEIYADAFTGTKKHRPQLDKLLKVIQNGDKVVVTKLDRIARSATQGIALIDMMLDKGVTVHILNMTLHHFLQMTSLHLPAFFLSLRDDSIFEYIPDKMLNREDSSGGSSITLSGCIRQMP